MVSMNHRFFVLLRLGTVLMVITPLAQPRSAAASATSGPDCCQLVSSGESFCFAFDATQGTCPGETTPAATCVAGSCVPSSGVCGNAIREAGEECDPPGDLCEQTGPGQPFLDCLANCRCGFAVNIDIKPGSAGNPVNPASPGVIPVALLGSDVVNAADVDVTTLAFGPMAAAPSHPAGGHLADVNQDGFPDLLSHYRTPETGILPGETEACLTGALLDGTPLEGCDAVHTVVNGGQVHDGLSGPERIACGGHIVFTNTSEVNRDLSVEVSLKDQCKSLDSEITCRTDINNPATEYDGIGVPDRQARTFICHGIPRGGGVFVVCNGFDGGCLLDVSAPFIPQPPGPQ